MKERYLTKIEQRTFKEGTADKDQGI